MIIRLRCSFYRQIYVPSVWRCDYLWPLLGFHAIDYRAHRSRLYFCRLCPFPWFLEILLCLANHAARKRINISLLIDVHHASFLELYIGLSPQPLLLTLNEMEMPNGWVILKDLQTIIDACVVDHRMIHTLSLKFPQQRIRRLFVFLGRCPAGLALSLGRQYDAFLLARGDLIMHSL